MRMIKRENQQGGKSEKRFRLPEVRVDDERRLPSGDSDENRGEIGSSDFPGAVHVPR